MSTALQPMTVDEFLLWAEGKEGRWELHDGVPVMMSPERVLHGDTKGEAYVALREAVRRAAHASSPPASRSSIRRDSRLRSRRYSPRHDERPGAPLRGRSASTTTPGKRHCLVR